jgi:hypothetical protein
VRQDENGLPARHQRPSRRPAVPVAEFTLRLGGRTAAASGKDDTAVAALAREFLALTEPPATGVSAYKIKSAEKQYEGGVTVERM